MITLLFFNFFLLGLWSIGTNSNEFIIKIKIDKYNGWYEQFGVKTEQMAFFNINDERRIFGIGYDGIGISIWLGTINFDDEVFLNKQYIGQHSVGYKGIIKSEIIEGKWNISGCEDGDGFFEFKKEN